ncbi:hypothetical protein [Polyangium sp. 6x1]|uniref:hypothetical protein n=1 Tax=Polyangium sp. 6x1 TaxID=3042689 RepID=UPI0024825609|nr:hypothetical protein [Polyangium sp. 6x1]MDI1446112.1 hypothetical protein [Polyangium sp. 6x1]
MRTLLSLGLLGCATMAFVPLGCGAKITYPEASEGPRVPDATAERLRECVDEYGGDLPRGKFTFDVALTVDEDGQVVDVNSKGVPHEELAKWPARVPLTRGYGSCESWLPGWPR